MMNEPRGDDIRVLGDVLDWVRAHPAIFFESGVVNMPDLAVQLMSAANTLGAHSVQTLVIDDWHVMAAAEDWFAARVRFPVHEDFVFSRLTPFPEAGTNLVRPEPLIAAFCAAIVVKGPSGVKIVKGGAKGAETLQQRLAAESTWRRAVAFRAAGA